MGLLNSPSAELYMTWSRGLRDLSERQIKHGILRSRDFTGFFNLPTFRELCHISPKDFGLPDCRSAYKECFDGGWRIDRSWSHPAVYHAAISTGTYEMQNLSEDKLWPLFKYNYELIVDRVVNGEEITLPIKKAIPSKIDTPKSEEQLNEFKKKSIEALESLKMLFKC